MKQLALFEEPLVMESASAKKSPTSDAEWLDDMILVGRLYVGGTRNEHGRLCKVIQADREVHHLLERLQGAQEEPACR